MDQNHDTARGTSPWSDRRNLLAGSLIGFGLALAATGEAAAQGRPAGF